MLDFDFNQLVLFDRHIVCQKKQSALNQALQTKCVEFSDN